jgi:hypothetical protein
VQQTWERDNREVFWPRASSATPVVRTSGPISTTRRDSWEQPSSLLPSVYVPTTWNPSPSRNERKRKEQRALAMGNTRWILSMEANEYQRVLPTPRESSSRRSVLRPSSPTPPFASVCVSSSSRTARRSPLSVRYYNNPRHFDNRPANTAHSPQ